MVTRNDPVIASCISSQGNIFYMIKPPYSSFVINTKFTFAFNGNGFESSVSCCVWFQNLLLDEWMRIQIHPEWIQFLPQIFFSSGKPFCTIVASWALLSTKNFTNFNFALQKSWVQWAPTSFWSFLILTLIYLLNGTCIKNTIHIFWR